MYDASFELRDWHALSLVVRAAPHGVFWPILGARRSGKTWALKAIEEAIGKDNAIHVKLNQISPGRLRLPKAAQKHKYLLFDEPSRHLFLRTPEHELKKSGWQRNIHTTMAFLEWCRKLSDDDRVITLALTPAEWAALRVAGEGDGFVAAKDLEYDRLGPLTLEQAERLPRTPAERQLFDMLPERWRRNPFLLVAIFRHALDAPGFCKSRTLTADVIAELEAATISGLRSSPSGSYLHDVLYDCLAPMHREALICRARQVPADSNTCQMLLHLGLLMRSDTNEYELGDPVLADHLPPPLRIHQISDLHFGPTAAQRVDAKDNSESGRKLAEAAGQGPVRDDYLDWLAQLPAHSRPHILIVSGDIAEKAQLDELAQGRAWLERVAKLLAPHPRLAPTDPRVLLVQGNHDVNWAAAEHERHEHFCAVFEPTGWPFPRLDLAPEDREAAHWHSRRLGVGIALLGSPEYGGAEHEHYGRIDPGLVHDRDIQRLRGPDWTDQPVRIAVIHHPLASNPSMATEVAPYSGLTNSGQLQAALLEQKFTLLLHGHTHAAYVERKDELLVAGAGTLGSRETYERHGFNEILVTREGDLYEVTVAPHERKAGSFVAGASKAVKVEAQ